MVRFASLSSAVCITFLAVHLVAAPAEQDAIAASKSESQSSPDASKRATAKNYGKLPLRFEINQGQTNARVKFLARAQGSNLFLSSDSLTLTIPGAQAKKALRNSRSQLRKRQQGLQSSETLTLKFLGASPSVRVQGEDVLPGKTNYYVGKDPKSWHTNVANYSRVRYRGVYHGIDLVYYGNESRRLEHDFIVQPGADPSQIAFSISGSEPLNIDRSGDLVLRQNNAEVRFQKPVMYQPVDGTRRPVQGRFVLGSHRRIHFEVASYDRTRELVIDPVLTYSTFVGGSGDDEADALAVDSAGNAYITGQTTSPDFPGAPSSSTTSDSNTDVFVTALDHTGTSILYTTYLGGGDFDSASGIVVDSNGNAYVAGLTFSTDFPASNGLQANNAGSSDVFVAKLDSTGAVSYSTYIGGTGNDQGQALAIDAAGNVFVAGITSSTDFPLQSALQSTNLSDPSFNTGFVTELNALGTGLVYSTYLGGSLSDSITGIVVDSSGNAYITGQTLSADFPTSAGVFQAKNAGSFDSFVAKINAGGATFAYSTLLGGTGSEFSEAVAIDGSGNAYVTGSTDSADFPTTNGFQSSNSSTSAYVAKVDPTGSALVYSTYVGGTTSSEGFGTTGYAIAVDGSGSAFVAGSSDATDFPVTNALQATNKGGLDAIVFQLDPAGSALTYSTYLGGSGDDEAFGVAVDASGSTYLAGYTQSSSDFPARNAEQLKFGGGVDDAFIAKISGNPAPVISNVPSAILTEATGATTVVTYSNPTAVDQANVSVPVICAPVSGSGFPLGTTAVNCTATDSANTVAHSSFNVTVQDTTAPIISNMPSPIATQSAAASTPVGWPAPTASDLVSGNVPVICAPASGSSFLAGITTVQCTATDGANNTATASFTVTIANSSPPVLHLPADITTTATSASGAVVNFTVTATSATDPNPVVACTPTSGSTFPVGPTTVQCTATDAANNSSSGSFMVTVGNAVTSNASGVPFINQPLVPSVTVPGGAAFTLAVNGTGFTASSVINWNGNPRTTTFVNGSKLTANIPASNIANASTAVITVTNPGQGGGTSNAISFPVTSATQFISTDRTDLFTTLRPTSVVSGDLDGDGKADLVVANHDSNTISVYMGIGDGTFAAAVDYQAGGSPYNLAVGDFDGNGKLDVVATLDGQDSAAIFLGNGDGTLQGAASFGTGSGPTGIAVGDFNRDGNLDVVVTNQGGTANSVSVLLGNGDGTLQAKADFTTGTQPSWVSVGDFNTDGNLDLVVADSGTDKVSVLVGNGDGTFATKVDYTVGSGPSSAIIADFNKDGVLDLAVANTIDSTISILKGKGDGTFGNASNLALSTAPNPVAISAADLDGDGNLDLAFTTNGFPGASVLLGNGDATFQSLSFDFITTFSGAQGITVADFNGDGRLDLAVANPNDTTVSVLLQSPSVSLSSNNLTFSGVKPGSNLSRTINMGNAGSAPLHIGSIAISGSTNDFSTANDCGLVLAGGASCTITVKFAPTQTGNQFASLTITDDAFDSPQSVFLNADGVTGPSSTSLATSLSAWTYGQQVSLTASVTPNGGSGTPTGAVTFSDGNGWFSQAVVIGGHATLNPSSLGSGIHTITATYQGDSNFSSSISNTITVTVTPANGTVASIQTTVNPSGWNQPVTFITKVTPQFGGIASGRVNFYDGATLLGSAGINSNNNLVLLSTSLLDAGTHSITAQYIGDSNVLGSTSPALSQIVNQATTGTGVISLQAQAIVGQPITLRATVGSQFGGTPTGSVLFKRGGSVLGSVPLVNAQADFDIPSLPFGTFTITALYSGDANNKPSKGTTTQAVKRVATTTKVASAQNPGGLGQPVTFTATVNSLGGAPPDGETITFKDGAATIGTGVLASGQATFTTSALSMGSHNIKAVYSGDAGFITSSGGMTEKIQSPTTTTLIASVNPSIAGKNVKFSVKVTSPNGTPGSSVTFLVDSVAVGTKSLNAGAASVTTSALKPGTHSITAQFNGGPKFAPSSTTITQDVQ